MNSKPVVVKMWNAAFDFANEVLKTIPLWIQLPKLPLNCWEDDSLRRIGSTLGVPIYANACTTKVERISYARILVEMYITRLLPKQIIVEDPNGMEFEQEVWYDLIPMYCNKCLQLGHVFQEPQKEALPKQIKGKNQKPQQFRRRIGHEEGGTQRDQGIQKDAIPQTQVQDEKQKGIENVQPLNSSQSPAMNADDEGWKTVKNKSVSNGLRNVEKNMGVSTSNGFNTIDPSSSQVPAQLITGKIIIHQSHKEFWMTTVYSLHTIEHRKAMWEELEQLHNELHGPWIVMGDYNAIQSFEDMYNGNPVMEAETRYFSDFLENTRMTELKTVGREFTWTNNHVYSRIDRALVNARCMMNMTQLEVVLQDPLFSDHTPVCVYFEHDHQPMPKLFKFFNNLAEHKEFQSQVKDTWEVSMLRPAMQRIWMKLKRLKKGSKQLNVEEYNRIPKMIQAIREKLQQVQLEMRIPNHSEGLKNSEKDLKEKWIMNFYLLSVTSWTSRKSVIHQA
uniref:Endonuclease/exonuclease/phosphatase domain-containing protein n=1 Tax=Nicotiana tabacum TaxID=4097 RepID=A0A1S3YAF5_TOBAC|nr:PREDICTED: uncharacterized protein LOC107774043 [Nicotiana tabacum]